MLDCLCILLGIKLSPRLITLFSSVVSFFDDRLVIYLSMSIRLLEKLLKDFLNLLV